MFGRVSLGLIAAGLVLAATPALACTFECATGATQSYGHNGAGYQQQSYAAGYSSRSGESYSRSVQVQEYGADYAGRPIDYRPGDAPANHYPQSSAYEARYDDGYFQGAVREDRYQAPYQVGGYPQAGYGRAAQAPCPPMARERVVRCVYRPIYEEIRVDTGIFDGGVGVIPTGGGGGGFVVVGGMATAGARAYASASASASVSVRGGGGHKGGGGCNRCGGGHGGKGR